MKMWKKVEEMTTKDHRITIREVADDIEILTGSCCEIFSSVLSTKCVAAKFVPNAERVEFWTKKKKKEQMEVFQELLNEVNNDAEL